MLIGSEIQDMEGADVDFGALSRNGEKIIGFYQAVEKHRFSTACVWYMDATPFLMAVSH